MEGRAGCIAAAVPAGRALAGRRTDPCPAYTRAAPLDRRPQVKGRNSQGCPVFFDGDAEELVGKLVPVAITEALTYSLVGEQAGEPY